MHLRVQHTNHGWETFLTRVCVLVAQLCPPLCDPIYYAVHEFSRPEYWSGLTFLSPGDLPYPGIEPGSPALQADSLPSEPPGKPTSCCCPNPSHFLRPTEYND